MGEKEFIEKYKGKQFIIESIEERGISTFIVMVNDVVLTEEEEDYFLSFYPQMTQIHGGKSIEIVEWV